MNRCANFTEEHLLPGTWFPEHRCHVTELRYAGGEGVDSVLAETVGQRVLVAMRKGLVTKHKQTVPEQRRGNFAELFVGDMSKIHPVHVSAQGCGNRKHTYGLVLSR